MLSVHVSAFFMHYPRYNTLAVRTPNCRLLQRHFRDVALRPARITDKRLSRMTCAGSHLLSCNRQSAAIFCPVIGTRSRQVRWKSSRSQKFWVHTYPTVSSRPKGRCVQSLVKIGSEMWICIWYKLSASYIRLETTCFGLLALGHLQFWTTKIKKGVVYTHCVRSTEISNFSRTLGKYN
jgi:hypothetical protein